VDIPLVGLARASLERLARFDVKPNRELGQNFLIDDNVLGVIGREAGLSRDDVVLEIGGGLGILSEYLARWVGHVHVVEADRRLEPVLREALAAHPNTSLVVGDVMDVPLAGLDPAPNKLVANLPYGVAVPAIVRTIAELPAVEFLLVMVQREIADRLAARPGSKTYGVPSVIVQLGAEVEFVRAISRNVFRPAPNVDSALVRLRRTGPAPSDRLRALVRGAFAHRRKALARSLEIEGIVSDRASVRAALEAMDHPADERAERLSPPEFAALAERLRP
jgi:16S rRNA (adenine1518-N6/adenine1519-N6)-dimethyltransferase